MSRRDMNRSKLEINMYLQKQSDFLFLETQSQKNKNKNMFEQNNTKQYNSMVINASQ